MVKNSRLKPALKVQLMRCFVLDLTATQTAKLLGINRNTVNRYYRLSREVIYAHQLAKLQQFVGEIEIDESYFGPRRLKGLATRRGRGTHRQPVFGIYERSGRVYTEVIPNCTRATLRAIISGKINPSSTIYSDGWSGYDGLVDMGYDKHFRIKHHKNEFVSHKGAHINGIESFWSFTKRRLGQFNGVKPYFELHLKECEWRWARSDSELLDELNTMLN